MTQPIKTILEIISLAMFVFFIAFGLLLTALYFRDGAWGYMFVSILSVVASLFYIIHKALKL